MATWNTVSTTDAMPAVFAGVGWHCLASALGAVHYWAHDREQTPWVEKIITDLGAEVWDLPDSDPPADGWIPEGLRLIRMFAEAGEGLIPPSLLDGAGGVDVAADLMVMTELLLAFCTMPEASVSRWARPRICSRQPSGQVLRRPVGRNIPRPPTSRRRSSRRATKGT